MTQDLAAILEGVRQELPQVQWEQLAVAHAADDDGLWFLFLPDGTHDVQIESSSGMCPLVVETSRSDGRRTGSSVSEVVDIIVAWLRE
jgi:hypothetical protein